MHLVFQATGRRGFATANGTTTYRKRAWTDLQCQRSRFIAAVLANTLNFIIVGSLVLECGFSFGWVAGCLARLLLRNNAGFVILACKDFVPLIAGGLEVHLSPSRSPFCERLTVKLQVNLRSQPRAAHQVQEERESKRPTRT